MKSDNPPIKHHYIPAFYLSQWAVSGSKLVEYAKVHGGKIVAKRKGPEATGFQDRLYEMKGFDPENAQQFEEKYFKPVDTAAAEALGLLKSYGHAAPWTSKNKSGWTMFIMSLLLRCPEDIEAFRDWWHEDFGRTTLEVERDYQAKRKPTDPATFSQFLVAQPLKKKEEYMFETLKSLLAHDSVGRKISEMQWRVLETPASAPPLLTSDRPLLRTQSLEAERGHIALPIGPRLLFIASPDPRFLADTLRADQTRLVKELNLQVVESAVRFVFAADESQTRFIKNRFSNSPQTRLIEQIIGRQRSADSPFS